jgi:hypothetical protein
VQTTNVPVHADCSSSGSGKLQQLSNSLSRFLNWPHIEAASFIFLCVSAGLELI